MQPVHDVAGEREERRVAARLRPGSICPPVRGVFQQRGNAGVSGLADRPAGDRCRQRDRGLVDAALDRVLQFELEQRWEPGEVDPVPPGQQATVDERLHLGAALHPPPGLVGLAEQVLLTLGPQRAERQPAAVLDPGSAASAVTAQARRVGMSAGGQRCCGAAGTDPGRRFRSGSPARCNRSGPGARSAPARDR